VRRCVGEILRACCAIGPGESEQRRETRSPAPHAPDEEERWCLAIPSAWSSSRASPSERWRDPAGCGLLELGEIEPGGRCGRQPTCRARERTMRSRAHRARPGQLVRQGTTANRGYRILDKQQRRPQTARCLLRRARPALSKRTAGAATDRSNSRRPQRRAAATAQKQESSLVSAGSTPRLLAPARERQQERRGRGPQRPLGLLESFQSSHVQAAESAVDGFCFALKQRSAERPPAGTWWSSLPGVCRSPACSPRWL
jgi:hypothetical protein